MSDPIQGKGGSNPVLDFVEGFVRDARTDDASGARIAGDLAGALAMGPVKGARDVFEGIRAGDTKLLIGGLIQLIPVAGGAAKSIPGASQKIAGHIAKKGVAKTALQYSMVAERAARKALNNPATREKLSKAAADAGQAALVKLVTRLQTMGEEGTAPDVTTREHGSFSSARDAAFKAMGSRPNKRWFDMHDEVDGRQKVVGRHELDGDLESARGFRFSGPGDDSETGSLYWWKNPPDSDPSFGMESFETSMENFDRIMDAYLNRTTSFRRKS